jgi:hypothetical protein
MPIVMEQDLYPALSEEWDDDNQRIIFDIGSHSIRNGDRISIRGITCTEDSTLFSDSKSLRAQVLDPRHIAIYTWRAPPRTIEKANSVIVDLNNIVRLSLIIEATIVGH